MQGNRTTRRRWSAAVLSVAAATAVLLAPATASATPTDAADAARLVAEAGQQLTVLDEQVHAAEVTVAEHQEAAAAAAATAAEAHATVAAFEPQLRSLAQTSGTTQSRLAAFLTGASAADVVQQMTTLDLIASHTEGLIGEVSRAQRAAEEAQAAADAAAAQATASLAELERQRAEVQARSTQYQQDFDRLSAAERTVVATALAGPTLAAPSTASVVAEVTGDAARTVISAALAQVGKPYATGGVGPESFDCSGLTQFAFAAAGVPLPHSSRAQSTMGTPVSRAELQPGDLVFYYSPVSHVAIYIGDGQIVHARTYGVPLAVTSVDMRGYHSARRVL